MTKLIPPPPPAATRPTFNPHDRINPVRRTVSVVRPIPDARPIGNLSARMRRDAERVNARTLMRRG